VIDLHVLRRDPDRVRGSQRARNADPQAVDVLLAADERRRSAVTRADTLRAEQKTVSAKVRSADPAERAALVEHARELAATVRAAQAEQAGAEQGLRTAHLAVANVAQDGAPAGGEDDYVVIREVGEKPTLSEPKDHLDLGERLGAIDTERGAKVSGARFYYLTGVGALLELALVNMAMAQAVEAGFTPVIVPALVRAEAMEGTGFLGTHAPEVYHLPADDLYLVGTSEVALAARHMHEIIDVTEPIRYAGFSSCFRREAGSYGKDTRGIIRVHQFDKVEMFSLVAMADADAEHLRLLAWEEEFLGALELPYRVIDVAAGDLGASAARKYDCEAWLPSQQRWLELTSTSNCTDFQARRLGIRQRGEDGRPRYAATLNGTLMASTRTIVALLENHQRADGSVSVPAALQPYLGRTTLA